MRKNQMIIQLTVFFLVSNMVFQFKVYGNTYIVKRGDVLSRIVQTHYPKDRLYGPSGRLQEVLSLNSQIKNPDLIYPNQIIRLNTKDEESNDSLIQSDQEDLEEHSDDSYLSADKLKEEKKLRESLEEVPLRVSVLYGSKYLSVSQSGALGAAEIGALFLNNIKFHSEFALKKWSLGFLFDSYPFRYDSPNKSDSATMYSLDIYAAYNWFLSGLSMEQNPLLRNKDGTVELSKMTVMSLLMGYKKDYQWSTKKPIILRLKSSVSYPLLASTDNTDVKLSSLSGIQVQGLAELDWQLLSKEKYALYLSWVNQIGYFKLSQQTKWENSEGDIESGFLSVSTALGLLIKF